MVWKNLIRREEEGPADRCGDRRDTFGPWVELSTKSGDEAY
jgi:hypothetical protein